jgi:HEAT repeat protein
VNVRIKAAYALAEFGTAAEEAIPALKAALKDKDGEFRGAVFYALRKIQPHQ